MSHYDWLDENFWKFLDNLGVDKNIQDNIQGIIYSHGDKCYSYKSTWEENNIPFEHGVAIYLLSYMNPWVDECRSTRTGWIPVDKWIVNSYPKFNQFLPKV